MQDLIINTALNTLRHLKNNLSVFLIFLAFSLIISPLFAAETSLPTVAITQIVQHGSLDDECKGIVDALNEAGYIDGKTIHIIYQNAQGNIATASLIANRFASLNPTVTVAISTPSTKTLLNAIATQKIPLVFTAVTDPLQDKLVSSLDARPENVTGVSDALLPGPQLDLIQLLVPSAKNIGVIYNPGETNSLKAVQQITEEAHKRGLTLIMATADKSSEIVSATTSLIGKVDAIYVPNDNTAVASIESIVSLGKKYQIPIFAGDAGSVERGALAAQAYDRTMLGREAGALVVRILKGEKAGSIPISTDHPLVLMINQKSARDMGVTIPENIMSKAKIVGDAS